MLDSIRRDPSPTIGDLNSVSGQWFTGSVSLHEERVRCSSPIRYDYIGSTDSRIEFMLLDIDLFTHTQTRLHISRISLNVLLFGAVMYENIECQNNPDLKFSNRSCARRYVSVMSGIQLRIPTQKFLCYGNGQSILPIGVGKFQNTFLMVIYDYSTVIPYTPCY
jgi:hypothetical protein